MKEKEENSTKSRKTNIPFTTVLWDGPSFSVHAQS